MARSAHKNSRFSAYFINHAQVLLASLGRLYRQPVAALMTIAVIAIALSLPSGLFISIQNIVRLSAQWDSTTRITVYMQTDTTLEAARALRDRLSLNRYIAHIELIDRDTGLAQFKQASGFENALQYLDENPLPHVLIIQPELNPDKPDITQLLANQLKQEKQIALVQIDTAWVQRLFAILKIAQRGIWVISILLALAVLLIIGNTIRLDIQNRRAEIEVAKLIGASNAFIRRPFLYTGLCYGLLGGLLSWLLVSLSIWLIETPVQALARLYHSDFQLLGQSPQHAAFVILLSCLLGLGGSALAVSRHLKEIEPS